MFLGSKIITYVYLNTWLAIMSWIVLFGSVYHWETKLKKQKTSYPLRSAPQRFTLAHQAPGESLLLAGGCGGFSQGWGGGWQMVQWYVWWMDWQTDGWIDGWMALTLLLCVLSLFLHMWHLYGLPSLLQCFYPVALQFSNNVVIMG